MRLVALLTTALALALVLQVDAVVLQRRMDKSNTDDGLSSNKKESRESDAGHGSLLSLPKWIVR